MNQYLYERIFLNLGTPLRLILIHIWDRKGKYKLIRPKDFFLLQHYCSTATTLLVLTILALWISGNLQNPFALLALLIPTFIIAYTLPKIQASTLLNIAQKNESSF